MATAKKGKKTSGKSTASKSAASKSAAGKTAAGRTKAKAAAAAPKKRVGAAKRAVGKGRELINTGTDKRYVRRRSDGTFKESDDVGRSLSADRRRKAKTRAKAGQGDRGDR
jgi:hypothetical protein